MMDNYLPIQEAASRLHVSESYLSQIVSQGKLRIATLRNGGILVSQEDLQTISKEDRPEYLKHIKKAGNPISISEASRTYGMPTSTITTWMQRGYIKQLGKDGRKTLLDEADVAYCVELYKANPGAGKWIFNPDGTPYQKKTDR